jgi:hypothetical protein
MKLQESKEQTFTHFLPIKACKLINFQETRLLGTKLERKRKNLGGIEFNALPIARKKHFLSYRPP